MSDLATRIVLLDAATGTGAGSTVALLPPRYISSVQIKYTGTPDAVAGTVQGSLDHGTTWDTLATLDTAAGLATGDIVAVSQLLVNAVRFNLSTLTGGSSPTVTVIAGTSTAASASSSGGGGEGGGGDASAANQATEIARLDSILAKIIAAPATEAKQDTGNTHLSTIATALADPATQTTLAAILAKIIAAPATEAKQDTGNTSLASILAKIIAAPATEAKQDTAITHLAAIETATEAIETAVEGDTVVEVSFVAGVFDLTVNPTVTNGAYGAGDIMGALLTFDTENDGISIQGIHLSFKIDVKPNVRVIIFNADPTSTTKTDNSPYTLNAADTFKKIATIPISTYEDDGTPTQGRVSNLNIPLGLATGIFYALVVDDSGVTLTSTSDMQLRVTGLKLGAAL